MSIPRTPSEAAWRLAAHVFLVFGVVGYSLVAFLPPLLDVPTTTFFSVPFRLLVFLLSMAVLARWGSRVLRVSFPYLICFALFWGLYLLRLAVDAPPDGLLLRLPWWEYWVWAIAVSAIPGLAALALPPRLTQGSAYYWLLLGLTVATLGNAGVMLEALATSDLNRLAHSALNPISVGHLGASLALVCLAGIGGDGIWRVARGRIARDWVILPSLLLLALLLLIASASRGPLLAFVLAAALLLWRDVARASLRGVTRTASIMVVMGSAAAVLVHSLGGALPSRVRSLVLGHDVTLSMRLERWQLSWRTFLDNPLLGGALETPNLDYPHNVVIEAFMATGFLGGLLFSAVLVLGAAKSLRLVAAGGNQWWLGLLALQFWVASLFSGTIYSNSQMWFLLGLAVAATSDSALGEDGLVLQPNRA